MTRLEIIPTEPLLGRSIIEHDPRSRDFPARGFVMPDDVVRRNKTWRRGEAYNQGRTSSCVGQTFKGILNTAPASADVPYRTRAAYDAIDIYHGAQRCDEWPGVEPGYYGTSALGACKYLRSLGLVSEYRWCFGLDDVLDTLSSYGPVGIGVWWYEDMFEPDRDGFLDPTGSRSGGHEVELIGINISDDYVVGMNSWGTGWGANNGRFKLSFETLADLLEQDGDAMTLVRPEPGP